MLISEYPEFVPIALDFQNALQGLFSDLQGGISEFSFAGLYLFREKYQYKISLQNKCLLVSGCDNGKKFFMTPNEIPSENTIRELFKHNDYWKCVPEYFLPQIKKLAEDLHLQIQEDRDNFDYLYSRQELAELAGKKFQKKRNLVNAYTSSFVQEEREQKPLTKETLPSALEVLNEWKKYKGLLGDFNVAKEALELHEELASTGSVYFVRNRPVGYCQGEFLNGGKIFVMHFEKALDEYKGVYQYINKEFAKELGDNVVYINREQDLGDEGLRQAKMTYRPVDFIKKYRIDIK